MKSALGCGVCMRGKYFLSVVIGGQSNKDRRRLGGRCCISLGVHTTVGDGVEIENVAINVIQRRGKVQCGILHGKKLRGTLESITRTRASGRAKRFCPHQVVRFAPNELKAR